MADNLLETYNPLYDVHLRQYFALPHMQKHLRDVGLLEAQNGTDGSTPGQAEAITPAVYARHQQMMELLLRNRERVLGQLADLHKKLDAAEKVDICRRIRSGLPIHIDEEDAAYMSRRASGHASRSLSRPARGRSRRRSPTGETTRHRRRSTSVDDSNESIKRIEADNRSDTEAVKNPQNIYNRLAASVYKYQYLHKMDDRTLANYKESLRRQLQKLERFRELSFGPNSVAKHQALTTSWFFKRRSSRDTRGGKSQSPPASASEAPPKNRYGTSHTRASYRQPRPEGESQQRLLQLTRRTPVKTTSAPQRPTPAPASVKTAKLPTVKPTIQQKRAKSTAKTANGKISIGKLIQNGKPPIASEMELQAADQLAIAGQTTVTRAPISPGSSIVTSSIPDAYGEDDTESRQSIDSALAGAPAEEDRAYSSRLSTNTYADSLNDDVPLTSHGGTATETRPTPEPVMVDDDDEIARHQFELPRNESMASLKTLNQASGVNEKALDTAEMPQNEKPSDFGFDMQRQEILTEKTEKLLYHEDYSLNEEIRNLRKREIEVIPTENDSIKADTYADNDYNIEPNQKLFEPFGVDQDHDDWTKNEKPTEEVVYVPPDTERNIVDVESKNSTLPSTPPSSAKEEVEQLAFSESANETEKEPITSDYSTSYVVKIQDQGDADDAEYRASDHENLQNQADSYDVQIADDENQISELELMEKSRNGIEHISDNIESNKDSENPINVSCHANADMSQSYTSSNDATKDQVVESQIENGISFQHLPEPKIEQKMFKPAPKREYISDEDDIVENTKEMRDEVSDYLKDAESVINTKVKEMKPTDANVYEKATDHLDANDNFISSIYDKYESESDIPVKQESVVSTEHQEETNLSQTQYSEKPSHREHFEDEFEDHDIVKNVDDHNKLLTENKTPADVPAELQPIAGKRFEEAFKTELNNLETTHILEMTPSEANAIKKCLTHHFPSTPQNSFSHLEDLDHNFAARQLLMPETQQNLAKNIVGEPNYFGNVSPAGDDANSHSVHNVLSQKMTDNNEQKHFHVEEEPSQMFETSDKSYRADEPCHSAENKYHIDEQFYQAYHVDEAARMTENNQGTNETTNEPLYSSNEEKMLRDNVYGRDDYESSTEHKEESNGRLEDDSFTQQNEELTLHHEYNHDYKHSGHLCAEKALLDDEDLKREGKGEITTFGGETRRYDQRLSQHLSHSEIDVHFSQDLTNTDNEEHFEREVEPIDENGGEEHHSRQSHNEIDAHFPEDLRPADESERFEPKEQPIDESGQEELENDRVGFDMQDEDYRNDHDHQTENKDNEELFRHEENVHNSNELEEQMPIEEQKLEAWQETEKKDFYDDDESDGLVSNNEKPEDVFHKDYSNYGNIYGEASIHASHYHFHSVEHYISPTDVVPSPELQEDRGQEYAVEQKTHSSYDELQSICPPSTHGNNQNRSAGSFLTQPSIEITPASDYGGSTEHIDQLTDARTLETLSSSKTPSQSDVNDTQPSQYNVEAAAGNDYEQQISYSNGQKNTEQESQNYYSDTDEKDRYNEGSKLLQNNGNDHVDNVDLHNVYSSGHDKYYRSASKNGDFNADNYCNNSDEDEDEDDSYSVVIHGSRRSSDEETTAQRDIYNTNHTGKLSIKTDLTDQSAVTTLVASAAQSDKPSGYGQKIDYK